jgi:thioredoxin 1
MKFKPILNISLLILLFAFAACNTVKEKGIMVLTQDNFSKETAKGVVLVDFWASWCMPCKAMAPIVDEIALHTKGKVSVGKVDIDESGSIANEYGINSIPTLLIFKDGKLMESFTGIQSKETLIQALSKYTKLQ